MNIQHSTSNIQHPAAEAIPDAHVDAVMSRAVAVQTSDRLTRPLTRWMAYLPGRALPTIWREDSASALAALRAELVKQWLPTIRELLMWERSKLAQRQRYFPAGGHL